MAGFDSGFDGGFDTEQEEAPPEDGPGSDFMPGAAALFFRQIRPILFAIVSWVWGR
jgi:hypothetical protein